MVTRKILPVRDVRQNISRLLDEAADGKTVMITRHGRPAGYFIGCQVLDRLLDHLEDLEDLYWMYRGLAEYRAGEGRPFEEFVAELESREQ
ncbi:MAG: type II toxin-antitoxin system Phd/YefM family antitoxin [Anaerolineae bacterium]|nr:type II toxin-antitoxin system Phd/YefM family antitoxin [Anaerolineae bacterium]